MMKFLTLATLLVAESLLIEAASVFPLRPSVASVASTETCRAVKSRVDCSSGVGASGSGEPNLIRAQCEARGCCFDDAALAAVQTGGGAEAHYCFYAADGVPITTVHMVNANHFDAGYTGMTSDVINEYFQTYFPRAAEVGAELRSLGNATSLKWMSFSYLISLFFSCPAGMNLECPSPELQANVTSAIKAGDIWWPAFPHNAELATGDASYLSFGVRNMSQELALQLGLPIPRVLSTRDVPGMPRASIPILKQAGVSALSEGMNGRIAPIAVPPAFIWKDEASGESLPVLWHWHVGFRAKRELVPMGRQYDTHTFLAHTHPSLRSSPRAWGERGTAKITTQGIQFKSLALPTQWPTYGEMTTKVLLNLQARC